MPVRENWVVYAGSHGSAQGAASHGLTLAHELGHYFGLPHLDMPDNLMATSGYGRSLNPDQLTILWRTISDARSHLDAFSCISDP